MIEILAGFVSGMITGIGMGGGTILILVLSLCMGMNQHIAQATNLIFFIPTAIVATIINTKNKNIEWRTSWVIIIFGIVGAIIGAKLSNRIPSQNLRIYFGIFLSFIAIYELYNLIKEYISRKKKKYYK